MGARGAMLQDYGDSFAWSLLDAAPDATLIVAPTGEIVFVNDQASELFGASCEDLLGCVVEDLLPESLRVAHRAHRTRYRAEPSTRSMGAGLELRARRRDGCEFPVEISLSPLQLDGSVFVVAAVRDITQRVQATAELQRSRDAVREAEHILATVEDHERIARDVFDVVIKQLFAASLGLEGTLHLGTDPRRNEARIRQAISTIDQAIHDLRASIFATSRPHLGIESLRTRLIAEVDERSSGASFDISVGFDGAIDDVDPALAQEALQVVREAMADMGDLGAREVQVSVTAHEDFVIAITVEVDAHDVPRCAPAGLDRRAAALGGSCAVEQSEPGHVEIVWRVPLLRGAPTPALVVTGPSR